MVRVRVRVRVRISVMVMVMVMVRVSVRLKLQEQLYMLQRFRNQMVASQTQFQGAGPFLNQVREDSSLEYSYRIIEVNQVVACYSASPSTAPISQVKIPHYACTSSAQHECPIGPEQESFTQACCIFRYCLQFVLPNESCAGLCQGGLIARLGLQVATRRQPILQGEDAPACGSQSYLVSFRTRPHHIAICVSQLQTAGSTLQVPGMF